MSTRRPWRTAPLLLLGLVLTPACTDDADRRIPAPQVSGMAFYVDTNANGIADRGDRLTLTFNQAVLSDGPDESGFMLPVAGDLLGTGARAQATDDGRTLEIVLGEDPSLKSRQLFQAGATDANAASGIDVSPDLESGMIVSQTTERDAVSAGAIDIQPAFARMAGALDPVVASVLILDDLDGDGDLDLLAASASEPSRVLFGDGQGSLFDSGQALAGTTTRAAALGDLDGDGDRDLVEGNDGGQSNRVYLNDGAGTFVDSQQNLGAASTRALAIGDLDGDGDLDFAAGNQGSNQIWLNDGTARFGIVNGLNLGGFATAAVELADFDLDGDLDLATGNQGTQPGRIYRGLGNGTFVDTLQELGDFNTRTLLAVDADRDGDLDLFEGNGGEANRLLLGDGSLFLEDSGQRLGVGDTRALAFADVDGDGDRDLLAANAASASGGGLSTWLNDGRGVFTDAGDRPLASGLLALAEGDLDRDGDPDLVVAQADGPRRLLGSLSGTWGQAGYGEPLEGGDDDATRALVVADFNGDGRLDFAEGTSEGGTLVLIGHPVPEQPFIALPAIPGAPDTRALAAGDLDGDGDLDLFEGNAGESNRLLFNDGAVFVPVLFPSSLDDTRAVALGDLDGDGDLDAVEGIHGAANRLWENDGQGALTRRPDLLGFDDTLSLALGDLDGDGDLDLVEGTEGLDRVWLNDGTGSFQETSPLAGSDAAATPALLLLDLDRDGRLDLFAASADGRPDRVWLGIGDGRFADSGADLGMEDSRSLAAGDVDGDGDLDVVVGHAGAADVLWLNDGSAEFSPSAEALGTEDALATALGDFDRDGDLDLLSGNDGAANAVRLNE